MKPKLTIGHFPIIDHLILGVARHHDGPYYKNLELATQEFSNWEKMSEALMSGVIQGTFMLAPLAMELFRKGARIKVVLLGQREGQVMIASPSITTPSDLKGKTVLVPETFSIHNILLHQVLRSAGLDPERDVAIQAGFQDVHQIPRLLHDGTVDAFVSAEPWGTLTTDAHDGYVMALSQSLITHHLCCVLVMRDDVISESPDAVQELVGSLVKAGMFMNAYPHQSAEIGAKFMGVPEKIALTSLTHHGGHVLFWDLLPRAEDFEEIQQGLINELKVWRAPIDLDLFLSVSFAQHAYRKWMLDTRREIKDKGETRTLPGSFRQATMRLHEHFPTARVTGTKRVVAGQRYPKADKERGFVTFAPDSGKEPDRVHIKMSEEEIKRCMQALKLEILHEPDGTYSMDLKTFELMAMLVK